MINADQKLFPVPANERNRIETMNKYEVLDIEKEPFDRLTDMAREFFDVDVATITLIDEKTQRFKASSGWNKNQVPRQESFCQYNLFDDDLMVVPDATEDSRFQDNPAVTGETGIRFYAGAPLSIEGFIIGSFCLIDSVSRKCSQSDRSYLKSYAQETTEQIKRKHRSRELNELNQQLQTAQERFQTLLDSMNDAFIVINTEWNISYLNSCVKRILSIDPKVALESTSLDEFPVLGDEIFEEALKKAMNNHEHQQIEVFNDSLDSWYRISIHPSSEGVVCYIQDITDKKEVEQALKEEKDRTSRLLNNVIPERIADRLKQDVDLIADEFENATALFADIVNFTTLTRTQSAQEIVMFLNTLFTEFDSLVGKYNLEKIKTIGDEYMVAGGIPEYSDDHAQRMFSLAREMVQITRTFERPDSKPLRLRIGINSGPVTAGVIGQSKYLYDLWGDTVNLASKMESQCEPNKIHLPKSTLQEINNPGNSHPQQEINPKNQGDVCSCLVSLS